MATIIKEQIGKIVLLTISNEARRNAFTHDMAMSLDLHLRQAEEDSDVRCIVITGAGDVAFSSGHDLREMLADRESASDETLNACFVRPATMRTPCIAAINGYAFAAGFILASSCDLRVCSENATFAAPGSRLGLLPVGGQLSRVPRLLPRAIAHEMLIAERQLTARDAVTFGFASQVVAIGKARDAALQIASKIVEQSPAVVREIKTALNILERNGEQQATDFEWSMARVLQSQPDATEGMAAFLEKRTPQFS